MKLLEFGRFTLPEQLAGKFAQGQGAPIERARLQVAEVEITRNAFALRDKTGLQGEIGLGGAGLPGGGVNVLQADAGLAEWCAGKGGQFDFGITADSRTGAGFEDQALKRAGGGE